MRRVFADTHYWVAILNDQDQSHAAAQAMSESLVGVSMVTTEESRIEVLAFFSERGRYLRMSAIAFVEGILRDPAIAVQPQSHETFLNGLALYKARPDKGYSLTDCISMDTIRREQFTEILTQDDHFKQEGFTVLL